MLFFLLPVWPERVGNVAVGNMMARAELCVTVAVSCVTRTAGGAGAVVGCGLARVARLLTAAWAMTEAIIRELEAQET